MIRFRLFRAFGVSMLLVQVLLADVTNITFNPTPPIVVGNGVNATVVGTGSYDGFSMQHRCTLGGAGVWIPDPAAQQGLPTFSLSFDRVGDYDVKGGAEILMNLENPPTSQWSYQTCPLSVIGPERDTFSGPQFSAHTIVGEICVDATFQAKAGSINMGGDVDGFAESKFADVSYEPPLITDWMPAVLQNNGTIMDTIIYGDDDEYFMEASIDDVLEDYYRENRVRIYNCSGTLESFSLGQHHLQEVKDGTNSWKLIEITNN